jgi:hypothetical protein
MTYLDRHRAIQVTITWALIIAMGAAQPREFTSPKFGFRMTLPPKWNIVVSESGVPNVFNYDPNDALPQGLVPQGGANIYLIPFGAVEAMNNAKLLDEWIESNLVRGHKDVLRKVIPSVGKADNSARGIVEIDADVFFDPDDPNEALQREVSFYFLLKGGMFHLMMVYNKDDPQGTRFHSVCEWILRSVRAL